jgi:hypothetical protein
LISQLYTSNPTLANLRYLFFALLFLLNKIFCVYQCKSPFAFLYLLNSSDVLVLYVANQRPTVLDQSTFYVQPYLAKLRLFVFCSSVLLNKFFCVYQCKSLFAFIYLLNRSDVLVLYLADKRPTIFDQSPFCI